MNCSRRGSDAGRSGRRSRLAATAASPAGPAGGSSTSAAGRRSSCRSSAMSCASAGTARGADLYRAIERNGNLIDAMLSEHRDMQAAKAFFCSAKATKGFRPERVTTDGHGSCPSAIRSVLGKAVHHRPSAYLNNRPKQDRRGIECTIRCMRGFKSHDAARRLCRELGEHAISSDLVAVTTRPSPPPPAAPASPKALASYSTSWRLAERSSSCRSVEAHRRET